MTDCSLSIKAEKQKARASKLVFKLGKCSGAFMRYSSSIVTKLVAQHI